MLAMNRLSIEFRRLFLAAETAGTDSADRIRAVVLELARPAHWQQLAAVWRGVQADLNLPAPAIAVNGTDGLQLWFSVAEPLETHRAQAFLDALCQRYLADVPRHRLTLMPFPGPAGPEAAEAPHAAPIPAAQGTSGHWSAFVAPDLAPLFDDTPWLDIPPGDDAQAGLLSRLESIKPSQWDAALKQLQPPPTVPPEARRAGAGDVAKEPKDAGTPADCNPEARRFLLAVMHDPAAPLALRIEAAKAVLPYR
ncbi:MAG TPA: hypothetical protein VFL86_16065 [Burkholderiaceae bacterium]|nr:hypothetical protein [Burkholderiaceae bacterium]